MKSHQINEERSVLRLVDTRENLEKDFWMSQAKRLRKAARNTSDADYRAAALRVAVIYEGRVEGSETMKQDGLLPRPQAATFQEAFDAAAVNFSAEEWGEMASAQRCAAIYAEMRRIDAGRFGVAEPIPPSPRAPTAA